MSVFITLGHKQTEKCQKKSFILKSDSGRHHQHVTVSASLSVLDQVTLQQLLKLFTFIPLMHTCIVMVCTVLSACSRLHPAEVFIYEISAVCSVYQTTFQK